MLVYLIAKWIDDDRRLIATAGKLTLIYCEAASISLQLLVVEPQLLSSFSLRASSVGMHRRKQAKDDIFPYS
jgi:hypothetical protein